jgi:hypothetical protein
MKPEACHASGSAVRFQSIFAPSLHSVKAQMDGGLSITDISVRTR